MKELNICQESLVTIDHSGFKGRSPGRIPPLSVKPETFSTCRTLWSPGRQPILNAKNSPRPAATSPLYALRNLPEPPAPPELRSIPRWRKSIKMLQETNAGPYSVVRSRPKENQRRKARKGWHKTVWLVFSA